jgi:hypothetical protein
MRIFVTRTTVAAAFVAAVALSVGTAYADENTDFLNQLSNAGISTGAADPTALGQSVCPMLVEPGSNFAEAVSKVQNNGVPPAMAGFFAGLAIQAYCPQMMSSIADGTIVNKLGPLSGLGIPGL